MKKYKVKKLLYSIVSIVMVVVLSMPVVAKAEDLITFTTYECVKDVYSQGSWQDMTLEIVYNCTNKRYDKYKDYLGTVPVSSDSYDYYAYGISGSEIIFLGFNSGGSYGFMMHSFPITSSSGLVESSVALGYLTDVYDDCIEAINKTAGYYQYPSIQIHVRGTYDKFVLNTSSTEPTWKQTVTGGELNEKETAYDTISVGGPVIDTNLNLYSLYEYNEVYYIPPDEDESTSPHPQPTSQDFDKTNLEVQSLTVLNRNMKHYDGENIVGGAPTYDRSIGFSGCTVEKINHPEAIGGSGAYITWQMLPDTLDVIDSNWVVRMNYSVSYLIEERKDGIIADSTEFDRNVFYQTIDYDIDSFVKQNGSCIYDLNSAFEQGLMPPSILLFMEYLNYGGSSCDFTTSFVGDNLITYASNHNLVINVDSMYKLNFIEIYVEIQLYNEKENKYSNSVGGHVDIIGGQNSTWVNEVSEDGSSTDIIQDSITSGSNYYNVIVETDSEGNNYYNYYYYDTTNNTVTPSIGGASTLNLIHTFSNSLNLTGISSSGGGSSSSSSGGSGDNVNVTIEDDDYTDSALREDISDGFGLLDNNETEELDDGFLTVASAFFESIDPDASQILMFGISSVVAIGILRAIFRR